MPTTASASQNAIRKISAPAATGCALIQAMRAVEPGGSIAPIIEACSADVGERRRTCGSTVTARDRTPRHAAMTAAIEIAGAQGRQLRPHRADARRGRAVRAPRPGATCRWWLRLPAWWLARREARALRTRRRPAGDAATAALERAPARPQLHGRRGDVPASAARRPGLFPRGAPPAAATASPRHRPQRPGQGSQLAGAGRRLARR